MSNKRNGAAPLPSHTVAFRLSDDMYRWVESRQAAIYQEHGVEMSLAATVRQILETVKRVDPLTVPTPKRKAFR
jgi:hypothetical protein